MSDREPSEFAISPPSVAVELCLDRRSVDTEVDRYRYSERRLFLGSGC